MIIKMKKIYCVVILSVYGVALMADVGQKAVTPTFVARSQGRNKLRQLVGDGWNGVERFEYRNAHVEQEAPKYSFTERIFTRKMREVVSYPYTKPQLIEEQSEMVAVVAHDGWYGSLSVLPEYTRSFKSDAINTSLFGSDVCSGRIVVQGSNVAGRDTQAWLADYFYLSPDFDGEFFVKPVIQNFLVDLDFYCGMDKVVPGLYLRLYGPITWTKWSSNYCEPKLKTAAVSGYDEGYFTPHALPVSALNKSISEYMSGKAPSEVDDVFFYGLQFARIGNCQESKAGFADLRMELGWDFIEDDYHHLAINAQIACPTGNMRDATYVLSPVVGNGNHWELGGGFTTHYTFWRNEFKARYAYLYVDLNMTHIFSAYEQRTFDLSDSPNSRYMLALRIEKPVEDGLIAAADAGASTMVGTPPSAQFKKIYSPVANLTTAQPRVSATLQVDLVALVHIASKNWGVDVGYNLWARTCEYIANARKCSTAISIFNENNERVWALKGDAHMFGYATATAGGLTLDQVIPLSATESVATIHGGTNALIPESNPVERNLGVDAAEFAYAGSPNQRINYASGLAAVDGNQIKTSNDPEFINYANINQQNTRGFSNTLFAQVNYTWLHTPKVTPYLGAGCSVEFGNNKTNSTTPKAVETTFIDVCDDQCITCSLSQWGIWVKAGFIFG
jgi:hypothetical protein